MFKVGQKVIPVSKTVKGYTSLDECPQWNKAKHGGQDYLHVVDIEPVSRTLKGLVSCNVDKGAFTGSLYHIHDLVPYLEVGDTVKSKHGGLLPNGNVCDSVIGVGKMGDQPVVFLSDNTFVLSSDLQLIDHGIKEGMIVIKKNSTEFSNEPNVCTVEEVKEENAILKETHTPIPIDLLEPYKYQVGDKVYRLSGLPDGKIVGEVTGIYIDELGKHFLDLDGIPVNPDSVNKVTEENTESVMGRIRDTILQYEESIELNKEDIEEIKIKINKDEKRIEELQRELIGLTI